MCLQPMLGGLVLLLRHFCLCCENLRYLEFSAFPPSSAASPGTFQVSPTFTWPPPEHLDVAEMTNVFATNVGGTCAATQAFLPLLQKSSLPRVLCISSCLGSISRTFQVSPTF